MAKKKSLVGLAKGKKGAKKQVQNPVPKKVEEVVVPVIKEDINVTKAKETVEKLLSDVDLSLTPKDEQPTVTDENVTVDEQIMRNTPTSEWLTDQITMLTNENQRLNNLLKQSTDRAEEGVNDKILGHILEIYKDIDNNLKGKNPERTSWAKIDSAWFLNKLRTTFPFIVQYTQDT
jgi:hypothetical protein